MNEQIKINWYRTKVDKRVMSELMRKSDAWAFAQVMFPSVPFYRLPRLYKAVERDFPPAPHGLWATWSHLIPVLRRQRWDPDCVFIPPLTEVVANGVHVGDGILEREAATPTRAK